MSSPRRPSDTPAREAARAHVDRYLDLLRDARAAAAGVDAAEPDENYWLKLELGDGRWTVDYRPLTGPPEPGDIVELDERSRWRVLGFQLVGTRSTRTPARKFVVLAPAA